MNILKPKTAKIGKMQVLDPKFSKITAPNFGPNSLCGPSTVFQGRWPNQGGAPQDLPQEATICSTGSLLELEMASNVHMANFCLQMAPKMANCSFQMAVSKPTVALWKSKVATVSPKRAIDIVSNVKRGQEKD